MGINYIKVFIYHAVNYGPAKMQETEEQPKARIISEDSSIFLDFVRFIAVQLVVIGHIFWFIDAKFNESNAVIKYPKVLFLANLGVILFFILSGMLISNSVFSKMKSKDYNFKVYFIDRFARIYSGLIPALIIIFILNLIHIAINNSHYLRFFGSLSQLNISNLVGNLFMLQQTYPFDLINYYIKLLGLSPLNLSIQPFGDAFQLWTLGIEWWIYLCFGWLILGLKKYSPFNPKFFLPLLFFSLLPIKFLVFLGNNLVEIWGLGMLATLVLYSGANITISTALPKKVIYEEASLILAFLALLRLIHLIKTGTDLYTGDLILPILIALSFIFVILLLNENKQPTVNKNISKTIKTAAGYSYTLYLIHFSVISFVFAFNLPWPKIILGIIAIILSNLLAMLVAYYTEMRHKVLGLWIKKKLGLIIEDINLQRAN